MLGLRHADEGTASGCSVSPGTTGAKFFNQFPADDIGVPIQKFAPEQVTSSTFTRKLNYVVTEDGELLLTRKADAVGGGHIDLAGGNPVQAAGEVSFKKGELQWLDNTSGHYLPSGTAAQNAATSAFENAGIKVTGPYIEKVWNGTSRVPNVK